MKTSFPACKQDGTQYTSLDEIMTALVSEPHGSWLAGTNRMWHGGIHLTEVTAPGSLLKPDASEKVVPLQCIAEGEVVAWRLNNDYIKSTCLGQPVQYSSTFVLVKSICKPDPEKERSWLEFYSLYMGLAPLSAFKKCKCMKAKTLLSKRKAGNYENSQGAKGVPTVPEKEKEKLAKDSRVIILKETTFKNGPEEQPFGLAQQLDKDGKATGNMFWVTMLPKYMEEDGEEYAHLPAWMHQAAKKGTFNEVVKPDATMKINAGDPVGFLGEDVAPLGGGQTSSSAYAHIEVMTSDTRMPAFLDNPEGVTSGRKFIRIKPGADIYTSFGDIFIKASTVVEKDIHTVLPEDKCHPREVEGKKYYQLSEQTWVISDDVDIFSQYDLKKLGFTAFAQESTPDMAESLTEEWVKSTFETYSEQVVPQRGIKEQQISDFYKGMIDKLDSDNNGELSGQELYEAVHNPALGIRDIAGRLLVKHESEWFGGSSHPKWIKFFETFDPLRKDFAKKWLDDMEWMSQVKPFVSGGAVWHMHPIMFLSALKTDDDCAQLIWGEIVNQRLGAEKGCKFRKKVVQICSDMWGEADKLKYADVLMGCMSVETNRMFSSSVIAYRKARHKNGDIIYISGKSGKRAKVELHVFEKSEIINDKSLVEKNAVGLIQFTSVAVQQINASYNIGLTKLQLALMDEIEQLDYVKLFFTSNKGKFEQIKTPEDVYTYIFCPEGVGKSDDEVLYSEAVNAKAYERNASVDTKGQGNNDGLIQKRELLYRLKSLIAEGEKYRNHCSCYSVGAEGPEWMPVALLELRNYKGLIETDVELNNKIKLYHNTANAHGHDGETSWCSSFVNWCLTQTNYASLATNSASAYSWDKEKWKNGEVVDKPFYGAIVVMNYSHVGFVCGVSPDGRILVLGGNQGGGRVGKSNCISIRANSISNVKCFMKPKGYNISPEDYNLKMINISGESSNYSDTH
ncbi:TIGR02594 family protein [Enterobacter sp.]|uniref:TIGR02594 family protein n=1 Tax=Enterobacter sp. TaxID=42895 RepID=UPI003A947E95